MVKNILIFDSGIGGLSILNEIARTSLKNHYYLSYFADQLYFPYGEKEPPLIERRVSKIINSLVQRANPSCIIIACNTVTSLTISKLRRRFKIPIIGVEPVIKPLSKFSHPLLLATKATINSERTKKLIELYKPHNFILYSPLHLATAIEMMNEKLSKKILLNIKEKFPNINAIGLSCTHYPLIKKLFKEIFNDIPLIDPSEAVAKQARKVCGNENANEDITFSIEWQTSRDKSFLLKQISYYYPSLLSKQ